MSISMFDQNNMFIFSSCIISFADSHNVEDGLLPGGPVSAEAGTLLDGGREFAD